MLHCVSLLFVADIFTIKFFVHNIYCSLILYIAYIMCMYMGALICELLMISLFVLWLNCTFVCIAWSA